ncbi:hypothetical protein [Streptomyces sp. NPDC050504]|uniref:hypothetical protein n=1 Tax=Streptomyces sp. NPDC050504 TaxID=3365618 RepID=UPI0037AE6B17
MKLKAIAGLGMLAASLASAAVAAPAMATEAPVIVPLQGLAPALPMAPPTLETGVPVPVPGTPEVRHEHPGGEESATPELMLPRTPITSELPSTVLSAPLPSGLDDENDLGRALVTTPASELTTQTPGASLGRPLAPSAEKLGLPEVRLPEAALLTPALRGDFVSDLGVESAV